MSNAPFRFFSKVALDESGCWLWQGTRSRNGYGLFYPLTSRLQKRGTNAHRYVYQLLVGPIPDGMQIDHLCRVRACVNPDHLEVVTPLENSRRGLKGELHTHCRQGHPMTGTNVLLRKKQRGRNCRECQNAANRRYRARLKAMAA